MLPKDSVARKASRVRAELMEAGVTGYGLLKSEARYLYRVIHDDETIGGVAQGRGENGAAMLVATNKRVLYVDKKPIFTNKEEITYDVVSGVKLYIRGTRSTVTLHTRVKDFTLRFVNQKSSRKFVQYIEQRRLEGDNKQKLPIVRVDDKNGWAGFPSVPFPFLTDQAKLFLIQHDTAVLSSIDAQGVVSGAVVYYLVDQLDRVYILTKAETRKAKNVLKHKQVALTIYEAEKMQTLQLQGIAEIETDQKIKNYVFTEIAKPRKYGDAFSLPPVTKLNAGAFVVIRVTPRSGDFTDYTQLK